MSYPSRIVSLEPSITTTLLALGQRHRLIGVSRHDARLVGDDAIAGLSRVPCTWSVQAQDLTSLEPDLVIGSVPMREQSVSQLLRAGLNVLLLYPTTLPSIYANIRLLAALTDARDRGEQIIADMEATFARLREQAAERRRVRVFMEVWPRPLINGPAWHVDLLNIVGATFVPSGPDRQLRAEEVLAVDPEVIVAIWPGVEHPPLEKIYARRGWEDVSAIRYRRVVTMPEIQINAPGPNLARGAEMLADAIWRLDL